MLQITRAEAETGLKVCTGQIWRNLSSYTKQFPTSASKASFYGVCDNSEWTSAFWTGQLWLACEFCGNAAIGKAALAQCISFRERLRKRIATDSHDLGFLYTLSCVAGYKLTGSEKLKETALLAADSMRSMFREKGEFIQSFDRPDCREEYRTIIDCLMNIPLLYWASEITGDSGYRETAVRHYRTTRKLLLRGDGSAAQAALFDIDTGEVIKCFTRQGYSDDSAWARGQAWAIYGAALSYGYTGMEECREMFRQAAAYYMEHLPQDMVPYFDLCITEGDEWPRDSSAAAIAACGMLEMAKHLEAEEAEKYRVCAGRIVKSLYDGYMVRDYRESNGLLLHGTYCCSTPGNVIPEDNGRDECCLFGDYFFMEALTRLQRDWKPYW